MQYTSIRIEYSDDHVDDDDVVSIPLEDTANRMSSQSYVAPSPAHLRSFSPDPLLQSTQLTSQMNPVPADGEQAEHVERDKEHNLTPDPATPSHPLTHDDLFTLFSSPPRAASPMQVEAVPIDREDDIPVAGPSRIHRSPRRTPPSSPPLQRSLPSSPLSSPPSPSSSPHPPSSRQSSSPSPRPAPPVPVNSHPDNAEHAAAVQAAEGRRYALRERNVRQLKPYAYDRQLYTRQMRSNPDAIVRFRSPGRRRREGYDEGDDGDGVELEMHTGGSSDPEVDPRELEMDVDLSDGERRRRKRRERSEDAGEGAAPRAIRASGSAEPVRRKTQARELAPPATAAAPASNIAQQWYQKELQELCSSSDSDDVLNSQPKPSTHGHEKEKSTRKDKEKKQRKKRFPMKLPTRSKSPSARVQTQVRPGFCIHSRNLNTASGAGILCPCLFCKSTCLP